jgi:hypothetical protein
MKHGMEMGWAAKSLSGAQKLARIYVPNETIWERLIGIALAHHSAVNFALT